MSEYIDDFYKDLEESVSLFGSYYIIPYICIIQKQKKIMTLRFGKYKGQEWFKAPKKEIPSDRQSLITERQSLIIEKCIFIW